MKDKQININFNVVHKINKYRAINNNNNKLI